MNVRKGLITTLMLSLILVVSLAETADEAKIETLHPDLVEYLQVKEPADQFFEGNGYIDIFGLGYFEENYREVAENELRNIYHHLEKLSDHGEITYRLLSKHDEKALSEERKRVEALMERAKRPLKEEGESEEIGLDNLYQYASCRDYNVENCIEETNENRVEIESILHENIKSLERYRALGNNDRIEEDPLSANYSLFHSLSLNLINLSLLSQTEAVLALNNGEIDRALALLMDERHRLSLFYNQNSRLSLMTIMQQVMREQYLDQLLNDLLTREDTKKLLQHYDLEMLFEPYDEASRAIVIRAIGDESIYFSNLLEIASLLNEPTIELSNRNRLIGLSPTLFLTQHQEEKLIEDKRFRIFLPISETQLRVIDDLQRQYPTLAAEVEGWMENEERFFDRIEHHFKAQQIEMEQIIATLYREQLIAFLHHEYNLLNQYIDGLSSNLTLAALEMIIEQSALLSRGNIFYLYRVEEQNNYHNLLYLKYRIMRDKIGDKDIPQFLESMGDLAKNRITKDPFLWDAQKRTLSTTLYKERDARLPSVPYETTHWVIDL